MSVSRLPVRSAPRVSMKLTATAACVHPAEPGPGVRKVHAPSLPLNINIISHAAIADTEFKLNRVDTSNHAFIRGTFLSPRE